MKKENYYYFDNYDYLDYFRTKQKKRNFEVHLKLSFYI